MRSSMLRAAACMAALVASSLVPALAADAPVEDAAYEAMDFDQLKALFDEASIPTETRNLNGEKHPYISATLHGYPMSAVLSNCADDDAAKGCTRLYMQSFTTETPAAADVPEKWNRDWAWAAAVTAGPDDRRSWLQYSYDIKGVNKAYVRQNFVWFTNSMANYWEIFQQAESPKAAGFGNSLADLKLGVARQKASGAGTAGSTAGAVSAFGP